MSNTYQVLSANYEGSFPPSANPSSNDPIVYIRMARNGEQLRVALIWWSAIQNIFAVAGTAGLQSYFAALADGLATNGTFNLPTFAKNSAPIPAPVTGDVTRTFDVTRGPSNPASCTQALVGSWTQ
jgi:hypothetical protein